MLNNLLIELNSKEPPVMDGSSKDFVSALKEGEIIDQKSPVDFLEITKPVVYNDEEKDVDEEIRISNENFGIDCKRKSNSEM